MVVGLDAVVDGAVSGYRNPSGGGVSVLVSAARAGREDEQDRESEQHADPPRPRVGVEAERSGRLNRHANPLADSTGRCSPQPVAAERQIRACKERRRRARTFVSGPATGAVHAAWTLGSSAVQFDGPNLHFRRRHEYGTAGAGGTPGMAGTVGRSGGPSRLTAHVAQCRAGAHGHRRAVPRPHPHLSREGKPGSRPAMRPGVRQLRP